MKILKTEDRLREYRATNNLSQGQVARQLGVSVAAVVAWEKGRRPSRANRARIRLLVQEGRSFWNGENETKKADFALRVIRARLMFGLTQQRLAEELEVTTTAIIGWEKRRNYPGALNEERFNRWYRNRVREESIHKIDKRDDYAMPVLEGGMESGPKLEARPKPRPLRRLVAKAKAKELDDEEKKREIEEEMRQYNDFLAKLDAKTDRKSAKDKPIPARGPR